MAETKRPHTDPAKSFGRGGRTRHTSGDLLCECGNWNAEQAMECSRCGMWECPTCHARHAAGVLTCPFCPEPKPEPKPKSR